jgi:hypothetical protein
MGLDDPVETATEEDFPSEDCPDWKRSAAFRIDIVKAETVGSGSDSWAAFCESIELVGGAVSLITSSGGTSSSDELESLNWPAAMRSAFLRAAVIHSSTKTVYSIRILSAYSTILR